MSSFNYKVFNGRYNSVPLQDFYFAFHCASAVAIAVLHFTLYVFCNRKHVIQVNRQCTYRGKRLYTRRVQLFYFTEYRKRYFD